MAASGPIQLRREQLLLQVAAPKGKAVQSEVMVQNVWRNMPARRHQMQIMAS